MEGTQEKTYRIGLVENEVDFREDVKQRLEELACVAAVIAWSSAEEFLRDSGRGDFDILFLDIVLPLMNGVDLARVIAEKHPDTKIIMLTNMNSDDMIFDSIKNGALGYVLKSELGDLGAIIRSLAAGGALITPTIALRVISNFRKIPRNVPDLTDRERQVLELMVRGKAVQAVADFLGLSTYTVQGYVKSVYKKLNVHNRSQLAVKANEMNLM